MSKIFLTTRSKKWAVQRPNASRALKLFDAKQDALNFALLQMDNVYVFDTKGRVESVIWLSENPNLRIPKGGDMMPLSENTNAKAPIDD